VPENGKRAFLLNKNAEGFSLYDIEQNFSLKPNNDITDDHLPTVIKNVDIVTNVPIIEAIPEDDTSKEKWTIKKSAENVKKSINNVFTKIVGNEKKDIEPIDSPLVTKPDSAQSNFIENITFNNEQSNTSKDTTSNTNKSDLSLNGTTNTVVGITNSDCKGIISNVSYQKLLSSITGKKTEDERLGLILASARQNCFNTLQASELVRTLDSDVAKYSALKSIYPKTSNQSDFGNLEALLNSDEWKEYFRNLVTHGK
jgi:hypothetical protein